MRRSYRCYPVRIDDEGVVWTLDGVRIGGPDVARAIKDGFAKATPEAFTVDPDIEAETVLQICKRGRAG